MSQELKVQKGNIVGVHYIGKFQGGKIFDTSMRKVAENAGMFNPSRDYKPLQVQAGAGQVIKGFDDALIGMKVNEEKTVAIPPALAYGEKGKHPLAGKTLIFTLRIVTIKR
ncbi:MAG: FKBP-type peptidyl-prolyl cis-trans isomerase [Candidatus Methanomethylicaceae archaeon]|jgi:FKBP-type peptidyl-prolyl cis-trans isomerase 2